MGSGFEPLGAYPRNPRSEATFEALDPGFSHVRSRAVAPSALFSLGRASTSPEHTGATGHPNQPRPVPIAPTGSKSVGYDLHPMDAQSAAPSPQVKGTGRTSLVAPDTDQLGQGVEFRRPPPGQRACRNRAGCLHQQLVANQVGPGSSMPSTSSTTLPHDFLLLIRVVIRPRRVCPHQPGRLALSATRCAQTMSAADRGARMRACSSTSARVRRVSNALPSIATANHTRLPTPQR